MTKTVDFIFDFVSPNAYLTYKAFPKVLEQAGAEINYIPCLLGGIFKATGNQPPMMAFNGIKGKMDYEGLEIRRFIKKHGLTKFRFNKHFPLNSIMMMRGALIAQKEGFLEAYLEAGFKCMWEDGLKMDERDVFIQAMNEAGFDGEDLLERTQAADIKAQLIENTDKAVERGVFGIPTFFVGEEMFFGKERLAQIEEALAS